MTPSSPARVLVVDDDPQILELLSATFRFAGYEAMPAATGQEAMDRAAEVRPDILVLDVMLPDIDGFEVVRRLRAAGIAIPVLFLTARDGTADKVLGLTIGADDYVTKPFSVAEVVARVQAVLRRSRGDGARSQVLACGDLVLDDDAHVVRRGEREIGLSPTEYRILRYLLVNEGRLLSKNQILDHVWQYDFAGDTSVVEKFVSNLRKKVDADGPPLIQTIRGFGYAIRPPRGSGAS